MKESVKFTAMPRYQMRKNALKKLLLDDMKKRKGGGMALKLLEIGYGAGEIFDFYKRLGLCAEGYDFSEAAYQHAARACRGKGIVLHRAMPEGRKYDYVVASEVLEHIEDDAGALKEWKSCLNDTGKMILSVPAHRNRWGAADVYAGHCRRYERTELEKKLSDAGMQIETIYDYDFPSCLLLDGMRNRSLGRKMAGEKMDRENASKRSGVDRDFHPMVLALSCPALWHPVARMQELFYKTDLGSAYILIASKIQQNVK